MTLPLTTPSLEQRVAVVTGASGSLGQAISLRLAAAGASIVVHYNTRKEEADRLVATIAEHGGAALAVAADLTQVQQAKQLIDVAEERFGRLDILVNNAGIIRDTFILDMSPEEWQHVIQLNLTGTFHCLRAAAATMLVQRSGSIINLSSVTSSFGWPGQSNYSASKAAIDALTRCAAAELARFNIRVNSVAPGMLRTEMSAAARRLFGDNLLQLIPAGRFGAAEEAAAAVLFLACDQSSYITGETINVRGGLGTGLPLPQSTNRRTFHTAEA
jgi:3-oxoacyl-[acyl-carrier protein] reductase